MKISCSFWKYLVVKKMNVRVSILFMLFALVGKAQTTNKVMNSLILNTLKKYEIPAISASLIFSDKIFYGAEGTTKINGNKKINLHSKFHLGSNTKAITSFIAMRMVQENKIALTTKFIAVFPELKSEIKKDYYDITLSDLLSHNAKIQPYTSGWAYKKLPQFKGTVSEKRYLFTKYVLKEKSVKKGSYSNAGYVIASLMLEKKSGLSFEALADKYLKELKLDYFIGFPNKETDKNPAGHWKEHGKWVIHSPENPYKLYDFMLSAGDMSMNIVDYSKFIQLNLNGLATGNFLSKKNYQKLHFNFDGYSYGWTNSKVQNLRISSHNGSAGTYFCHTVLIPKRKIAIIVMANSYEKNQEKGIYQLRENILKNLKRILNEI